MGSCPVFFIPLLLFLTQISLSASKPLVLPLTHSLAKSQFNATHHLLKSTSTRSTARFRRHQSQVSLPLSPGTDYTISLSLGTQTISLYMDTGSDVVWLPCSPFTCILCEGKTPSSISNPKPFILTNSSTPVTCQSRACSDVHSRLPTSDLCSMSRCPLESVELSECQKYPCPDFYYAYGDGSFVGRLYRDNLVIPMSSPSLTIKNLTFGCAHAALGEPIGVAGFGRGALSLPAQLSSFSPQLGNQFSYCLVSHSFDTDRVRHPSPLILGRYDTDENKETQTGKSQNDDFVYTPMLENPKHPYFYSIGLEGVTVGKRRVAAPPSLGRIDRSGNGGMVVDSGTTFTMLPAGMYDSVINEFDQRVGRVYKRAGQTEDRTGLSPCYFIDDSLGNKAGVVPQLVWHFGGNSSVVMPRRNYFHEFLDSGEDEKGKGKGKRKVGCMMLINGGDFPDSGGPSGLLGNYQQQGLEVVYDLENKRVGFAKRKCASLWESLNQG